MAGSVTLGYAITKQAWKLVKAGKATISSGGVRLLNGELYELAKPVAQGIMSKSPLSPINLVSSLANNVQSGFIQHGVNVANGKLDIVTSSISGIQQGVLNLNTGMLNLNNNLNVVQNSVGLLNRGMNALNMNMAGVASGVGKANGKLDLALLQLKSIQSSLGVLNAINALSWASLAFNIAGCGISIAGFQKTLQSISKVSEQIKGLDHRISKEIESNYIEMFDRYSNMIKSDIQMLQNPNDNNSEGHFTDNLGEINAYLKKVISSFMADEIKGKLACNIIFGLIGAFAQEVQYFTVKRYYQCGEYPAGFNDWTETISFICNADVNEKLKKTVTVEYMDLSTKAQNEALQSVNLASQMQIENIAQSILLTQKLDENDYLNFDKYLSKKLAYQVHDIEGNENSVYLEVV